MVNSEWKKNILKPITFYIVFFLFILAFCTTAIDYDLDLWARLIAGMGFIQTGHVLKHDFLSYTPTHTWFDHEWGSGVIFYLTHHFFSAAGILFLQAISIFLIFFVITKIVKLKGVKTTTPYNFLFYYFSFMAFSYVTHMPVRCQNFSFLFFTIFLYILESARFGKQKYLWFLPLLMLVWNNLHGGCIAGVGLIVLYIIGEFFNRKPIKKYIYALAATLIILPINPWGFEYLGFLFKANTMQRPMIMEWLNIFTTNPVISKLVFKFKIYALILLFTEIGLIIKQLISKEFKFDATKFLVISTTVFFAVWHIKLIPFAVISLVCFLYDDFYTVFNTVTINLFNKIAIAKDTLIYILILIFAFSTIKIKGFGPYLTWFRFPIRAVEFIRINKIEGKVLQDFSNGSYVSYKLYPQNKIFMDGRYEEVYLDEMLSLLNDFCNTNPGWNKLLKLFPPDIILLQKDYTVFKILKTDKKWKIVFEDQLYAVFVKSSNVKKHYKQPSTDINYYKKTLFDTNINMRKK